MNLRTLLARLFALVVATAAFAPSAHAGMDDVLRDTFGSYVNVTDPGSFSSARRGILTGGSVYVRNRFKSPTLVSFQPPSLKASCSGISFFGGTFSAINIDEFNEYVRAVMSNSLGYLFQIGLESICPTCTTVMQRIKAFADAVSNQLKDSCQMSKQLATMAGLGKSGSGLDSVDADQKSGLQPVVDMLDKGIAAVNNLGTYQVAQDTTDTLPGQQIVREDPDRAKDISSNLVLSALIASGVADKILPLANAASKKELYGQIMALTGTITVVYPDNGDRPQITTHKALADFEDLLNDNASNRANTASSNEAPQYYDWTDGDDVGLTLTRQNFPSSFRGMKTRVASVILGTPSPQSLGYPASVGLVEKFATALSSAPLTAAERSLQDASAIPIVAMMQRLGGSPEAQRSIASVSVELVAVEILSDTVNFMMKEVESSLDAKIAKQGTEQLKGLRARMTEIRQQIDAEVQKLNTKPSSLAAIYNLYEGTLGSLRANRASTASNALVATGDPQVKQ